MKHLTEEEWIEYYYGESPDQQRMQEHIGECAECAAVGRDLARDLAEMRLSEGEPQPGPKYGNHVWQALHSSLTPYPRTQNTRRSWGWPVTWNLRLGLAGVAVVLVAIALAAFYSGRMWEQKRAPQVVAANNGQAAGQRVILFVVSDHLDRSQRLLAELDDPDEAAADHGLQTTARELLTENRLYRQSSARVNGAAGAKDIAIGADSSLETILDDLEPVLVELANQPNDLNRKEIIRLRKELNTGGLLFEIHVLRSKVRGEAPNGVAAQQEGTV
jgi:hypothetical protein